MSLGDRSDVSKARHHLLPLTTGSSMSRLSSDIFICNMQVSFIVFNARKGKGQDSWLQDHPKAAY